MDTNKAASWLSNTDNQKRVCDCIGDNILFKARIFNIIAFNVPLSINPTNDVHRQGIHGVNNMDPDTILKIRWVKVINRRSPAQKTAQLILTTNNANMANRAITNGLNICNKHCHIEKIKHELTRCLNVKDGTTMQKIILKIKIYVVTVWKTIELTNAQQSCGNATYAKPPTTLAGTIPVPHTSRKLTNLTLEILTIYYSTIQQQAHGPGPKVMLCWP